MSCLLKRARLLGAIASLAMAGCDPSTSANQLTDLKDTSWKVAGIPKQVTATISFGADGRVTGNSGCNRFFGTYKLSGHEIQFGNIGGTKKMCPEIEMSVERELLKTLAVVSRWQGTTDEVELTSPVNSTLIRLKKAR